MPKTPKVIFLGLFAALLVTGAIISVQLFVPNHVGVLGRMNAPASQVLCVDDIITTTTAPCVNTTTFTLIQDAINVASAGDEIRVAAGTYVTTTGTAVVTINRAVTLTGGYPGGVGGWTTPGDETQTVIDGQGVRDGLTVTNYGETDVAQNFSVVNGGIVLDNSATLNNNMPVRTRTLSQSSGIIGGSAPITVTNVFTWNAGEQTDTGSTDILPGAQFNIPGLYAWGGRVINNYGTATWSGAGDINLPGATFNNQPGATFTILNNRGMGSGGTFNNFGTIVKSSAGDTTINYPMTFNNSGLAQIDSGRLAFGLGSSTGTFNVAAGATLALCNCGTHIFQPSSVIAGAGTFESGFLSVVSGTFTLPNLYIPAGQVNFDSVGANTASTVMTLTMGEGGGTGVLGGTRTMSVTNVLTLSNGYMYDAGRTDILPGAQFNIIGLYATGGRVINNYGTATWSSTGNIYLSGATFNNEPNATFTILNNQGFGSSGTFNNFGTIIKSSAGDTYFADPAVFNNSGLVRIDNGRLLLCIGSSTGAFNVAAGATLGGIYGETYLFQPESAITGSGTFESGEALAVVSGTFTLPVVNMIGGRINFDSVGANAASTVMTMTLSSGSVLGGTRTISVTNVLNWWGYMTDAGRVDVLPSGQLNIVGGGTVALQDGHSINNYGAATWSGPIQIIIYSGASLNNEPDATFSILNNQGFGGGGTINNFGTIIKSSTGNTTFANGYFTNQGLVDVLSGTIQFQGNASQTAGTLRMSGGNLQFDYLPFALQGGTLEGTGTITGSVDNSDGTVSPGLSPGLVAITGNYTQGAGGTLNIELGGLNANQYDRLAVGGTATLNGVLNTSAIDGFTPQNGDPFTVLTYGSRSGTFATIQGGTYTANYNAGDLTLVVGGPVSTPTPTGTLQPTSTSTRTPTNTPTNTLTNTPTKSSTNTPTNLPTSTTTLTPTSTRTNTATSIPTSTSTNTPSSTATNTPTRTNTPPNTSTATNSPTLTSTNIPATGTATNIPATGTATNTSTITPTSSATTSRTATVTQTTGPTSTPTPIAGCWSIYSSPNLPSGGSSLNSIAVVSANDVWAVGSLTSGRSTRAVIEHWNGTQWSLSSVTIPNAIGVYLSSVHAISANDVWAVGYHEDSVSGIYFSLTMHWDGTSWTQVASPSPAQQGNFLYSVDSASGNDVWAVGLSAEPSSFSQPMVMHYNGTGWQLVTNLPSVGFSGYLFGLDVISAGDAWAAGSHRLTSGDLDTTLTWHWDGAQWSNISNPSITGYLYGVSAASANDIWAVGTDYSGQNARALTMHWNGSQWTVAPNPAGGPGTNFELNGVATLPSGEAWAVGYTYDNARTVYATIAMHLAAGGNWAFVPSQNVGTYDWLAGVAFVSANDVWAVGFAAPDRSTATQTLVERFSSPCNPPTATPTPTISPTPMPGCWSVYSSPNSPGSILNVLADVGVVSANDVWAVGYDNSNHPFIQHWNGSQWSIFPATVPGAISLSLSSITVMSASDIWAVGSYHLSSGTPQTLTMHYNGTSWSQIASPSPGTDSNYLYAVDARATNDVWAVGTSFSSGNSSNTPLVLHYGGSSWQVVSLPTIPNLYYIGSVEAVAANDVWVGGSTLDTQERPLIVHYDGTTWNVMTPPAGADVGAVYAIGAVSANDVWAVGYDNSTQPTRALTLHWNGSQWSTVSNPGHDPANYYTLYGITTLPTGEVWAVGEKSTAQNVPSTLAMHWGGGGWAIVPSAEPVGSQGILLAVDRVSANDVWAVGESWQYNPNFTELTLVERWTNPCNPPTATPTTTQTRTPTPTRTSSPASTSTTTVTPTITNTPTRTATTAPATTFTSTSTRTSTNRPTTTTTATNTFTSTSTRTITNTPTRTSTPATTSTPTPIPGCWSIYYSQNTAQQVNQLLDVGVASADDMWAVGKSDGDARNVLVEHWNGATWAIVPVNVPDAITSGLESISVVDANNMWAVGFSYPSGGPTQTLIMHWDGSAWSRVDSPSPGRDGNKLHGIDARAANDVWAVGYLLTGSFQPLVLHYDGTNWQVINTLPAIPYFGDLYSVKALASNNVWVAGYTADAGVHLHPLILHYNGSSWAISTIIGLNNGVLNAIEAVSANDIWAVGTITNGSLFYSFSALTVHFDGISWVEVPNPGSDPDINYWLNGLTATTGGVWAVGETKNRTSYFTLAMRWTGSSWVIVPTQDPPGLEDKRLNSVAAVASDDLWTVGSYDDANNNEYTLVERFTNPCVPPTSTPTNSPTLTNSPTRTPTSNPSWSPTRTPSRTPTRTPTSTATRTNTLTVTATPTCGPAWRMVNSPNVPNRSDNVLEDVVAFSPNDAWAVGYSSDTATSVLPKTLIEHWDGSHWSIIPSPNGGTDSNYLASVAGASANDVWAVGYYDTGGSGLRALLLHWNGSAWSSVPAPNVPVTSVGVQEVGVVSSNNVWVVGSYLLNTTSRALALHWDGSSWVQVPMPTLASDNTLTGLGVVSANDIWAVGEVTSNTPLFMHWNGSAWSQFNNPVSVSGVLEAVSAVSANDVWAVGFYTGGSGGLTMHYNGTSWSPVDTPLPCCNRQLVDVQAIASNDVWAVNSFGSDRLLHWDGSAWNIVPNPDPPQFTAYVLEGLGRSSANDVWAVGHSIPQGGATQSTLVEHYSDSCPQPTTTRTNSPTRTPTLTPTSTSTVPPCGPVWRTVSSPNYGTHDRLTSVSVIRPDDIWAAGDHYEPLANSEVPLTMHWDGSHWTLVPNFQAYPSYIIDLDAVESNDVWAVGYWEAHPNKMLMSHWDGSHWGTNLQGISGEGVQLQGVSALATDDVWAVGYSTDLNGNTRRTLVVHWNGSQWSVIPSPNPGSTDHLSEVAAIAPNNVWAVGGYTDGIDWFPLILHWNGSSWGVVSTPSFTGVPALASVSASSSNDVWAVGNVGVGSNQNDTLTMHWNGSAWTVIPSPSVAGESTYLFDVADISPTDVWAVGASQSGSNHSSAYSMHWNGGQWSVVSNPPRSDAYLDAVDKVGTSDVWAAGVQSGPETLTEHYNDPCATPSPTVTVTVPRSYTPTPTATRTIMLTPISTPTRTVAPSSRTPTRTATPSSIPTSTPTNYAVFTATGTVVAGTLDIGNHCDACVTSIPLPFPATLYDRQFSSARIGSNGTLGLAGNSNPNANSCIPSPAFNYGILPFWDDLDTTQTFACPTCGIYTSVSGGAPSRVFNIEWRALRHGGTIVNDFEVRLYEQTDRIDVIWGTLDSRNTASAGIQRDTGSVYLSLVCNTLGAANRIDGAIIGEGIMVSFLPPDNGPMPTPTACPIQFLDVPEGSTFYPYIKCLACRGIISGYSDGTFRPANDVTRGQIAKFVSNSVGLNDDPGDQIFEDVPPSSTFYDYVQRLAARGSMSGYPCGGVLTTEAEEPCVPPLNRPYFRPDNTATRAQVAKIVSHAASFDDTVTGQTFEDVGPASTFYLYIERLERRGIVSGYDCGRPGEPCVSPENRPYFRPQSNITRGQTAKIVSNTFSPYCQTPVR